MNIRAKLTLVLTLCMACNTAAAALFFFHQQRRGALAIERERVERLLENVVTMARESDLADDVLMLVEYLRVLRRSHPELAHWRVRRKGRWIDEGKPAPEPACCEVFRPEAQPLSVEVWLRRDVRARRLAEASRAAADQVLRLAAVVLALGLSAALVLGRSLTWRLRSIERAIEVVAAGRWGEAIPVEGKDEIARLTGAFNAMSRRLLELDGVKKTFAASVTHELRSPLGAIQSQVREALARGAPLDEPTRLALDRIRGNAERLERFVGNLLQLARIEKGKLEYQPRRSDLRRVVEEAALFFRPRARELGLELRLELQDGLPELRLDPELIGQVLANFVSNALKYTPAPGSVTLGASLQGGEAVCAVVDTGVGIEPGDLQRLFLPFERIPNPVRAGGTGLGLAIAKHIVDLHGGRIGAESAPGRGSRFFFSLPVDKP